ncbi:MAG: phosphotransferase [Pseudomonadota bacterium]
MDSTTDIREQLLQSWLSQHYEIVENSLVPVSGDASFRRYFRFTAKNTNGFDQVSLVAIDAPPDLENSQPFVDVCKLLRQHECVAPEIFKYSLEDGFFVIEDFGNQLLLDALNNNSVDHLYGLAIQSLIKMQTISAHSLPKYNSELLQREMHLFTDWYLAKHKQVTIDDSLQLLLNDTYALLEENALAQPQVFVHRDYHSRNLMILDYDKLGIIDFQDAVEGPITYDLVSLLRDCYIDWPQSKIDRFIEVFMNLVSSNTAEPQDFIRWFDLMGLQRHLKAIGIFCRLNYRDNKSSYLNDIPRTITYVERISAKYDELNSFNKFICTLT